MWRKYRVTYRFISVSARDDLTARFWTLEGAANHVHRMTKLNVSFGYRIWKAKYSA